MPSTLPVLRPADHDLAAALAAVDAGEAPRDIEIKTVDFKEEAGRRKGGQILDGATTNEEAVRKLCPEVACMANTTGGGALVVGVADDGTHIGTELEAEWLRGRIYSVLDRKAAPEVIEYHLGDGTRLLVIRILAGIDPITNKRGKVDMRIDDECVEVTIEVWRALRPPADAHDWSRETSGVPISDARAASLELARTLLAARGTTIAAATDADLLVRLGAATEEGFLTNAGVVAFTGLGRPAFDYRRRDHHGGDSTARLEEPGLSLLEELDSVLKAVAIRNEITHRTRSGGDVAGIVHRQHQALPAAAVREVLVNAASHRDWQREEPIVTEHVGDELVVESPGGFIGGVNPSNIITHGSAPRNRALAEVLQKLGLAEREGIGVDRIFAEMISAGHPPAVIEEIPGPNIRAVLIGGPPNEEWISAIENITPPIDDDDVSSLLILDTVTRTGWIDEASAAPVLQRTEAESRRALERLETRTLAGAQVITRIAGTPPTADPAWRPSRALLKALPSRLAQIASVDARADVATQWSRGRGRISSTELADIVGVKVPQVQATLKALVDDGVIEPARGTGGRGFHYLPTDPGKR